MLGFMEFGFGMSGTETTLLFSEALWTLKSAFYLSICCCATRFLFISYHLLTLIVQCLLEPPATTLNYDCSASILISNWFWSLCLSSFHEIFSVGLPVCLDWLWDRWLSMVGHEEVSEKAVRSAFQGSMVTVDSRKWVSRKVSDRHVYYTCQKFGKLRRVLRNI